MRALRILGALFMILGATVAHAAPPPCWPSITNPPQHVEATESVLSNGDTYWASWRCPDGMIYMGTFNVSRILPWVMKVSSGLMTTEEANAASEAWPKITADEDAKLLRMIMVNYYGAQPKALMSVVFKRRIVRGAAAGWVRVGRISAADLAAGVDCDIGGLYNTYMRIVDVDKVVHDSKTAAVPLELFTQCG